MRHLCTPLVLVLLLSGGCSHDDDYDAIVEKYASGGRIAGDGDGDGDTPGDGDGDGDVPGDGDGDGDGDGPNPDACLLRCMPPPTDQPIAWENCCTGLGNLVCGLRAPGADACIRRNVVSEDDPGCPTATLCAGDNCTEAPGCCRADGHCGLAVDQLGCVDRTEIPRVAGGPFDQRVCSLDCDSDADCGGIESGFLCVNQGVNLCARACENDLGCGQGEVCGLRLNVNTMRHEIYCQLPVGDKSPGSPCQFATDCSHNLCAGTTETNRSCSAFCAASSDCGVPGAGCAPAQLVNGDGTKLAPKICSFPQ